jgi:tripartite-type tricarboxylate transporter receptor subunit TctC
MIFKSVFVAALLGISLGVQAQSAVAEWPNRSVRIIVPYAPGGTSDKLGRLIAQHLQTVTKQSVVVENRAGAGGTIGSAQVAKAAPDGYNLVVSGVGSHVIAPVEMKVFNPMTDFTHIALLGGPPLVFVLNPSVPANNLKELIAYVQRSKDGLSWGSPGQGTHGHLVGELFMKRAELQQTHISYKGSSPALSDLVAGQIPAAFMTFTSANAFIKAGKLKAIAITATQRIAEYPTIPTFAELGYPELTSTTWFSLSGPAGMPAALVDKINAEVRRGLKTDAAVRELASEDIETHDWDAATFTRFVKTEIERYEPLVRSLSKQKAP